MGREWRRKVLKCEKCHSMEDENIRSRAQPNLWKKDGKSTFQEHFYYYCLYWPTRGWGIF